MTRKEIQQRQASIEKRAQRAQRDLKKLQTECKHPAVHKEHKANTGNYDPSADCYWTEFTCPDCGKYWTEDQ